MSDFFPRIWPLSDISPGAKLTMLAIARFSVLRGFCWASVKTIADATGYGDRATRGHISELEEKGYIERRTRKRPNGGQASNIIWLKLPEHREPALSPPARPGRNADFVLIEEELEGIGDEAEYAAPPGKNRQGPPAETGEGRLADSAGFIERLDSSGESSEVSMSDSGESDARADLFGEKTESEKEAHEKEVTRVLKAIWEAASEQARRRSGKRQLREAISSHLGKGKLTGDRLIAAWRAYIDSPDGKKQGGVFQKAPCRWIRSARYETFLEELDAAASPEQPSLERAELGTDENPTELAQRLWMMQFDKRNTWRENWGPQPGEPGCRVSAELQREFGYRPAGEEG